MGASSESTQKGRSPQNPLEIRALIAQAKCRFARAGIAARHLDRAVLECIIAAANRSIENPIGYCLAVGRRLQDETERRADRTRRVQRLWIENACRHGALDVAVCPRCAEDRQRALELFPSLSKFLGDAANTSDIEERQP